jgi:predicted nucleic acid-binding protein
VKIIIADSSALIILEKCRLLDVLAGRYPVVIPGAVYQEVVNDRTLSLYADAEAIAALVAHDKINVAVVSAAETMPVSLGRGESEAIVLAKQMNTAVVATDDGKAVKACRYLGVPFIISPKVALALLRRGAIDFNRAKAAIEKMKLIGRYSTDIISEAMIELEVMRDVETDDSQGA